MKIDKLVKWFIKTGLPYLGEKAIDEVILLLEKQKEKLSK